MTHDEITSGGSPLVALQEEEPQMTPSVGSDDLKARVARVLVEEVAPALQLNGIIEVCDIRDGEAQLRLAGVCGACPSTIWAVVNGLEQELRQRFPEVEYVELLPL